MDRLTTDNRETNLQTLLNYAYAKDRAVHLAYGNGEDNIPLDEYIAHEASAHGCPKTTTEVMEGGCMECDCPIAILNAVAIQAAELRARLMMIEDILGATYNLDHLRELIEAEREGRIHILPCVVKPGDTLYILGYLDTPANVEILGPRYVVRTTTERIYYKFDHTRDKCSILDVSWSDIGKSVFLSREEAEAALAKMKEV